MRLTYRIQDLPETGLRPNEQYDVEFVDVEREGRTLVIVYRYLGECHENHKVRGPDTAARDGESET